MKSTVTLTITGPIIQISGLRLDAEQGLIKEFSYELKNAFFIKKAMMAKGVMNYQPMVRFYNPNKGELPIGFLNRLKKYLTECKYEIEFDDRRAEPTWYEMPDKLLNKELRDYQIRAADFAMQNRITFLQLPTGSGKTTIAAEIIRRNQGRALFVVDRNILLNQTIKEFQSMLGRDIGSITEGKMDLQVVTVATIQTLTTLLKNKNTQLLKFLSEVKTFIIDESHTAASKSYIKLSNKIPNATMRIGLSASYTREDGDEMMIESCVGRPEFKIEAAELTNLGHIMKPKIYFIKYVDDFQKHEIYHEAYDAKITNNKTRNELILKILNRFKGHNILIIISKIEHGRWLESQIGGSVFIHGTVNHEVREKWLAEMKNSRGKIIIGTSSIVSKGLDVPNLDVMLNATGNLSSITTIQSLGRVLRNHENKKHAYYIDFKDLGTFFKEHTDKRIETLQQQGYEVKII